MLRQKIRGRVLGLPRRGPLLSNSLLYGDNYLAVLRKNGEIQALFYRLQDYAASGTRGNRRIVVSFSSSSSLL